MKAREHLKFNPEFPEKFNWDLLDSVSLTSAALRIQEEIEENFETNERIYISGLRLALNIIANIAEIYPE